eukprot:CFRG7222T1
MPCDTFVCVGNGYTIFGKNSDRPSDEEQVVEFCSPNERSDSAKRQCTYISVPGNGGCVGGRLVLSRPSWMVGAEMGANEHGVAIGNEAVWTNVPLSSEPALLGMDLVRLGLERSKTACQAVEVITRLLELHGQGGSCVEGRDWSYHNSFLIADSREAWVLETAGKVWVAEHIRKGTRSISNNLSIHRHDMASANLYEEARKLGWDNSSENADYKDVELDFAEVFAQDGCYPDERELCGRRRLVEELGDMTNTLTGPKAMMRVLRTHEGGICAHRGTFATTGSQVSLLYASDDKQDTHWFTGTSFPCQSIFKPLQFKMLGVNSQSLTLDTASNDLWHTQLRIFKRVSKHDELIAAQIRLEEELYSKAFDTSLNTDSFSFAVSRELEIYHKS